MHSNGNDVYHKKSNNSSVKTENYAHIYLEESHHEADQENETVVSDKSFLFILFGLEEICEFLASHEGEDRHDWQVLNEYAQLNYLSEDVKEDITSRTVLILFKTIKNGLIFAGIGIDVFNRVGTSQCSDKANEDIDESS